MLSKKNFKRYFKEWFYITIGIIVASIGYSFFVVPNNIVTGGVSGLGVLLMNLLNGFDPSLTILIANIIFLVVGLFFVGKDFFLKTVYGSIAFPLFIELTGLIYETIGYDLTTANLDITLIILFAAILIGYGLGLSIKHGGSTGGTEVLQKIAFKYFHIPFSISLYVFDGVVILLGMVLLGNVQNSLYAIVFTILMGYVMDSIIFSGFNKRAVYIISNEKEEIKKQILEACNRGVTSMKVVGEYSKQEKEMLVCVLSSNEYYKLRDIIENVDPKAFYFAVRASEVRGEGFSYDVDDKN